MKVEAILKSKGGNVVTIRPDATVGMALHRLTLENIGALVVTDGEWMAGIISERDIVHALTRHRAQALEMPVSETMTRSVVTCRPEDSLGHMMKLMTRHRIRHLPVLNEDGRLAGIVSLGDAVRYRLDELELEANVLRDAYVASH